MAEVPFERAAPLRSQAILRPGDAPFEGLGASDVPRLFELTGVDGQVAVGRRERRLQLNEGEMGDGRERADDPQPHALANEAVELRQRAGTDAGGTSGAL